MGQNPLMSDVFLNTHLDRRSTACSDDEDRRVVPFLLGDTTREVGTFATRHPSRPNLLGLGLVSVVTTHPGGCSPSVPEREGASPAEPDGGGR
jgi:tRNA (Thr-GGU) A37 N-methylase